MDFSKLNNDFMNMQKIIYRYNDQVERIKNKIKYDLKMVAKYKTKVKKTNDSVEKTIYNTIIEIYTEESYFLTKLLEVKDDEKKIDKNS